MSLVHLQGMTISSILSVVDNILNTSIGNDTDQDLQTDDTLYSLIFSSFTDLRELYDNLRVSLTKNQPSWLPDIWNHVREISNCKSNL